ncbi:MAG: hypothetical protein DSZ10_03925, partial [Sulfurovum sp.]
GEVVFNTAMTGYQEILSDPSYCDQIITLTYPHIGNVGVNPDDEESSGIQCAGLIIRDLPLTYSSWRGRQSLDTYLQEQGVVAIADIDTPATTGGSAATDQRTQDISHHTATAAALRRLSSGDDGAQDVTQHTATLCGLILCAAECSTYQ